MGSLIALEHRGGAPWVRLEGDVDMRAIVERASDIYAHTCDSEVTIDLAAIASLDGSGLTVLLMTLRAADSVRLINVPPAVRSLLDVSGTADVFAFTAA